MTSARRDHRLRNFLFANFAVFLFATLILGMMFFALTSVPAKTEAYTERGPIFINGDSDFTIANGVVSGDGAPANPYIISGWRITLSSGVGITVQDTTSHFVILDVQINGTANLVGPVTGISFNNVFNGHIKDCLINSTNYAVDLWYAYDGSVQENRFLGTMGWAMKLDNCARIHVTNNYFQGQNGIQAVFWSNSNALLNEFLSNEMCISGSDINTLVIKENKATGCGHPVSLSWSTNLQVMNNLFVGCTYGLELSRTTWTEVRGNIIEGSSATGISIRSSSYKISVSDNVVNGTQVYGGIVIENSWDMTITRNMISNNSNGFGYVGGGMTLLTGCSNMLIFNNSFMSNTPEQAEDRNGPVIRWNGTYPVGGNYWSDYTGVDLMSGAAQDLPGSDGFGDTPVEIDADSKSFYPLMVPVHATLRPVAGFTMNPQIGDIFSPVTFNGSSSYHPDPMKAIIGYRWDFDCDGVFDTSWSSNPGASRLYQVPGVYTVVLEVEDQDGMTGMTMQEITIQEEMIPEFASVMVPVFVAMVIVLLAVKRKDRRTG